MKLITPDWPAPDHIRAFTTTRQGGTSLPPYDSLNLGDHVADLSNHVSYNRQHLTKQQQLPESPRWLSQTHSTKVIDSDAWFMNCEADAIISQQREHVCTVLTADCLPVLLTDIGGTEVAAIHAGWRGLAAGIIENTIEKMSTSNKHLIAWLGPAIGPQKFEVGSDVYDAFISISHDNKEAFNRISDTHFLADIYRLARQKLYKLGIRSVHGGEWCTVSDSSQFFSYRRDGETGRMASVIWIADK